MTEAVQELLRTGGILAPIVILFGWYILNKDREIKELRKELSEAHEARTRDAQGVVTELMGMNDKWTGALNSNTLVLSEIKTLIGTRARGRGEQS